MSTSANGTEGNIHVTWGWGTSHKLLAIQGRPNWTLCELKLWLALPKSKGKNKIKWKLWSTNMCWLQRESIFHSCNTHALYDVGIGFSDGATLQWSTANKPRQWQNLGEKNFGLDIWCWSRILLGINGDYILYYCMQGIIQSFRDHQLASQFNFEHWMRLKGFKTRMPTKRSLIGLVLGTWFSKSFIF